MFNRMLLLLITFISSASTNCPTGLTPIPFGSQVRTCSPQAPCSCPSGGSCQFSSTQQSYICCGLLATSQCGSTESAQLDANGRLVQCVGNQQCHDGFICQSGVCCHSPLDQCQSDDARCLRGQVYVNNQCYTTVEINEPCLNQHQCVNGSTCASGRCACPSGQLVVDGRCSIDNGIDCPVGWVSWNRQCVPVAPPGEACQSTDQCIDNSACLNRKCECSSGYRFIFGYCVAQQPATPSKCLDTQVLINNQCQYYSIPGESCIADIQCVGGSVCRLNQCQCIDSTPIYGYCLSSHKCPPGQVFYNGQCINTVAIGSSCLINQQCTNGAQCLRSVCQCPSGTTAIGNVCVPQSSNDAQCSDGRAPLVDSSGQLINCMLTACPQSSSCQYSSKAQKYVCCWS